MSTVLRLCCLLSSLLSAADATSWFGAHFECVGRNRCYDDQLHCRDGEHCVVHCSGDNACQYSVVHCPVGAHCTVTCSGGLDSCKDAVFLAKHSTSLSIACDAAEDEACDEMVVYCPDNGSGGPAACQLGGVSAQNVVGGMDIFAVEGLGDLRLSGSGAPNLRLHCHADYSSLCALPATAPFARCTDGGDCDIYPLPTSSSPPTAAVTPRPSAPSIPPTLSPSALLPRTARPTLSASLVANVLTQTASPATSPTADSAGSEPSAAQWHSPGVGGEATGSALNPLYYVMAALAMSICCVLSLSVCWVHHNRQYRQRIPTIADEAECAMSPPLSSVPVIGPSVVPAVEDSDGGRARPNRRGSRSAALTAGGDTDTAAAPTTAKSGGTAILAPTSTLSVCSKWRSSTSSSGCASSTVCSSSSSCSSSSGRDSAGSSECKEAHYETNGRLLEQEPSVDDDDGAAELLGEGARSGRGIWTRGGGGDGGQSASSDEESNLASSVEFRAERKRQRTHCRLPSGRHSLPH